ncbi:LacI family DNA-binding transcriptional regulator [Phytoactinopolyspora halotolerans]|uniref:LacI family transcriptional regulator n=1 Tax=Phytoactinopolyspora halotolerans TaxID=1981512 RepID=A0A6L9SHE4_9ACTN|nr:LacI family DNA-binding transcriptional regulator [Phytoactinopolyspora halotolerans]NEE04785.1 LacI family transcriptional regulator [Phytoactinopolyspora halotolerans]
MAHVTMKDVARLARVSPRTVSNVVNDYTHVSDDVRRRVVAAIDELGYRPNIVARNLRIGRTGLLALIVPEIDVPYFSELARAVIDAAADYGYRVMIDQTGHDHERERQLLTGHDRTMLFDGILFSPLVTQAEIAEMDSDATLPMILLGEHAFTGRFDHIAIDNTQAAYEATHHLVELGRRRIAAIGTQPKETYQTPQQRTAGYFAALDDAALPHEEELVIPAATYHRSDGYDAARRLLAMDQPPDAIFCYSDLLAMGAMRAVQDARLRIPDDVAVIGIDDIEEGRYSTPSLSTVSLDKDFIATRAVERLVERIEKPELDAQQIVAPHTLIVRDSTRPSPSDPASS